MKSFYNIEVINVVAAMNSLTDEQLKVLPVKIRWALKKNMPKLEVVAKQYEDFRDELIEEIRGEFFNEEKSESTMIPQTDENGNQVLDENGCEVLVDGMKVKNEFIDDYQTKLTDVNEKLNELLMEKNEYNISTIDLDAFVDSLPDDSPITFELVDMLSFMDKEGDE